MSGLIDEVGNNGTSEAIRSQGMHYGAELWDRMEAALLAAEGCANWCDILIEMVEATSCDPDDPEAFGEAIMGARHFLAAYREAVK